MIARTTATLALGLALTAGAVQAQELIPWGSSDYWQVMIDPTLGNGCLIQGTFADGSTVRIGLDRNTGSGYVTFFNETWDDVVDGEVYPVAFALDGEQFEGQAKGIHLGGVPGADIAFDNVDFFKSIAQRQTMTMYEDGEEALSIDLTGTSEGLEAVLKCQDEQG